MAELTIEERLARLEAEMDQLLGKRSAAMESDRPWWERIHGMFQDSPDFEEAVRLGRQYRESLRPDGGQTRDEPT